MLFYQEELNEHALGVKEWKRTRTSWIHKKQLFSVLLFKNNCEMHGIFYVRRRIKFLPVFFGHFHDISWEDLFVLLEVEEFIPTQRSMDAEYITQLYAYNANIALAYSVACWFYLFNRIHASNNIASNKLWICEENREYNADEVQIEMRTWNKRIWLQLEGDYTNRKRQWESCVRKREFEKPNGS